MSVQIGDWVRPCHNAVASLKTKRTIMSAVVDPLRWQVKAINPNGTINVGFQTTWLNNVRSWIKVR